MSTVTTTVTVTTHAAAAAAVANPRRRRNAGANASVNVGANASVNVGANVSVNVGANVSARSAVVVTASPKSANVVAAVANQRRRSITSVNVAVVKINYLNKSFGNFDAYYFVYLLYGFPASNN